MTGGTTAPNDPRWTIRRAEPADTAAVQAAYRQIIDHLGATVDFVHWHTTDHPKPYEVADWVAAGDLYLVITNGAAATGNDRIAGCMVLDHETPGGYEHAAWSVAATPDEVLVIHVLGVVPTFLRTGVAQFLVTSALDIARDQGCLAVRLDTYVDNLPARKLYERCGLTDLGPHDLDYEGIDLNPFHLFEYVL